MKVIEAIQFLPLGTLLEVVDSNNRHFFIVVCDKILLLHVGEGFTMCKYELFNSMRVDSVYILSMVTINLFFLGDVLKNFPNYIKETYDPEWKEGKEEAKLLPDNYKKRKDRDEDIRTISCEDIRFVTMLGPDLVLDGGREKDQLQTAGNKKKRYLDIVGLADYRTGTNEIRSLAKKLYYLQDFASEILYELRLNMRQLDGNVLVYDVANMPKEFLKF